MLDNRDAAFINKLTEIVNSNLTKDNFGVNDLAEKMGVSHSQIHRKLKRIKDQSISQFIKEIRLTKANELLKQNNLNVSEVAYKVGFGSPSYFNKCYHDFFGNSPGENKKQMNKVSEEECDIKIENNVIKVDSESVKNYMSERKFSKINYFIVVTVLLIGLLFALYFYKEERGVVRAKYGKSVAILPLKNLNNNVDEQYLANGIMSDIQNRLSHVKDIVVKSNITSEKFDIENKTIPQIAKEFEVSYILEGSMLKKDERIRIYVHLIDTKANVIWSDQYDHNLSSIFSFVSDVSKQIVQNLLDPLQIENIRQFDKQYTHNEKAYLLYLEGRFYYRLRTAEGFNKSIELYNQALKIDSNYSLAYSGLADSYLTGTWNGYYPVKEGISKCRKYLNKAMQIDPNLAEAHTTNGGLSTYFDSDYKAAEKHLKLALELNPGYDRANKIYAEFCDVTGNNEEARRYINKAHFLNPTYQEILYLSYLFYCHNGDCENALKESNRIFNLNKNEKQYLEKCFDIYLHQHKDSMAFNVLKKLNKVSGNYFNSYVLDSIYAQSKMHGIIQLLIEKIHKEENSLKIDKELKLADYYTMLGEKKLAVEYLEKSFAKNPAPVHRVYNNIAYQSLHTEPKFKALIKKMNLNN